MNSKIKDIVRLSIISALYVVLTVMNPFSYNMIQFRISEILMLLCFFRKDYSYALIVGCFISNLFSEIMLYDIIFGTFATVISCIVINNTKNIYIAGIAPVVFNGLIVGAELSIAFQTPYFLNVFWVSLGELVVMIIGILAFLKLKNNTVFMELIKANKNIKDD